MDVWWDVGCVAWGSGSRMRGGRDQLGQAINCLMFAFLSLLWVRKGLIHFPQSSLALSTSAEESMAGLKMKHLINCVGLGWGESGRVPKLGPWWGLDLLCFEAWHKEHRLGFVCLFLPKKHCRTLKNNFLSVAQTVAFLGGCH